MAGDPRRPHLGAPRLRSSPVPVTKAQLGRVRACLCCLSNLVTSKEVILCDFLCPACCRAPCRAAGSHLQQARAGILHCAPANPVPAARGGCGLCPLCAWGLSSACAAVLLEDLRLAEKPIATASDQADAQTAGRSWASCSGFHPSVR